MTEQFTNFAQSALSGSLVTAATSVTLVSGAPFPSSGDFRVTIEDEIVLCTARSGNTLTIVRAQEGTTAVQHASGVVARHNLTAASVPAAINDRIGTHSADHAGHTVLDDLNVEETLRLTGIATVTSNFGTANNYNPGDTSILRIKVNASTTITGLAGGVEGRVFLLQNVYEPTARVVTLTHEDSNSTAGNRFRCPNNVDLKIGRGDSVLLVYDDTEDRWNVLPPGFTGTGPFVAPNDVTSAQMTSNEDDKSINGFENSFFLRLHSDAAWTLTGIAGGSDGRLVAVRNAGSFDITLAHNTGSSAGNRFICPGSTGYVLSPNAVVWLYHGDQNNWTVIAPGPSMASHVAAADPHPQYAEGSHSHVGGAAPAEQVFTANGTWTKPVGNYQWARIIAIGAGGGGGGGRRGAEGESRSGGSGGGGGGYTEMVVPFADLPSALTINVGAGGTAGAAATSNGTDGGNGGTGGTTEVLDGSDIVLQVLGGFGGGGGIAAVNAAAPGDGGVGMSPGAAGGVGRANATGHAGGTMQLVDGAGTNRVMRFVGAAGGGGGGGGRSAANANFSGGAGQAGGTGAQPGAGGNTTGPVAAGAGAAPAFGHGPGSGGGGGYGLNNTGGAGGTGGDGARGGGGGGGGGRQNGSNSGAGGVGGDGYVAIICWGGETWPYLPPKYESVASAAAEGTSDTLNINRPTGTVEGDLLLAVIDFWINSGNISARTITSAGWNVVHHVSPSNLARDATFWKIAGPSEPANYDFVIDGGTFAGGRNGAIVRVSGAHPVTPIIAAPTPATASSGNVNPPASGTVALGDYLAIAAWHDQASASNHTPPANYTERVDVNYTSVATRDVRRVTAEDPGTGNNASGFWTAFTYLIAPKS